MLDHTIERLCASDILYLGSINPFHFLEGGQGLTSAFYG
jgi:hypothetical protein